MNRLYPNKLYKHRLNQDVAAYVLKTYYIPKKQGFKVKLRWFNIAHKIPFDMNIVDNVFIKETDIRNWDLYDNN